MAVESSIGKQIREVLATSLRRDPSPIKPEHSLREDLGLDSLMTFELLYDLEKAFDMEIPNDDLPGLLTLDDVVKYVEGRVNRSSKAPGPKAKTSASAKPAKTAAPTKAKKIPKIAQTKPRAKVKPAAPAKAKKPATTGKARAASTPTKSRSTSASAKRVPPATNAATKKRTPAATPKAKKK